MCVCACVIVCLSALGSLLMTMMMILLCKRESLKPPTPQRLLVQNQFLSRCLLNGIINSLNVRLSQ